MILCIKCGKEKDGKCRYCLSCMREYYSKDAKRERAVLRRTGKKARERIKEITVYAEKKRGLAKLRLHQQTVENSKRRSEVRAERLRYKALEGQVKFIVKDESWNKGTSKALHIELIIRAIVSYQKLTDAGIVHYAELAFLLTGSQLEFFVRKDIEQRYGKMFFFKRDIGACIEAGYIGVMRGARYFLKFEGKERLNAILGHIYREKSNGYTIRERFDK